MRVSSSKRLNTSRMTDYLQPDFYRFNEDSIKLVKYVALKVTEAKSILDLGAGSGIIGIELSNILKPKDLTLLEVQPEWNEYLQHNVEHFLNSETKAQIVESSFANWEPDKKYDLIVCNPPYYLPGHGQPNADKRKAIARSFMIDGWKELLDLIARALTPEGRAFLVVKNEKQILKEIKHPDLQINSEESGDIVFLSFHSF